MSTLKIHGRTVNHQDCPVVEASKIVGDFWNLWIIRILLNGPARFSSLQNEIDAINKTTLNNKLKLLINCKLVRKSINDQLKPEYSLTEKGSQLKPIITALEIFGNKNF